MRWSDVKSFLRGGRLLVFVAAVLITTLLLARFATDLYIDLLWYDAVGYTDVFWTRTLWQWGLQLLAGVITAVAVYVNLKLVSATLGAIQIKRRVGDLEIVEKVPQSYVFWSILALSAIIGLWFGAAIPGGSGLQTLVFFRAPEWGTADPFLGRDLAFYIFSLPVLRAVLLFLLVLVFSLAGISAIGYAATGSLGWSGDGLTLGKAPRVHLAILAGSFLFLLALQFWLGQYGLLQQGTSSVQGIFGFADAEARIPGHRVMAALTLVCAGTLVWGGGRNRSLSIFVSLGAVFGGGIVLLQLYPGLIQRFRVEPNELARETPYIEQNLAFTRAGFRLDELDRRSFDYTGASQGFSSEEATDQMSGFPVWNDGALLTTYREVEARFRYYQFPQVDFDRYPTEEGMSVVALSARQIDPASIEDPNWQNLHLRRRYIAGMGAVASTATGKTSEGRPRMILTGIPPVLSEGPDVSGDLALTRPSIFYGTRPQLYAVLNPGEGILELPSGDLGEAGVDYPPGILLDSPLRTLALAWRYRDANLLFSTEISDQSRFILRRQIQERVREIAPFLLYLEEPYPVIHDGRTVWMMDAFTASRNMPVSSVHVADGRRLVNYIRNSVKITVDAVSGEIRFYSVMDEPILEAYRRAFPDLFRPLDEMPEGLRSHIRYPRALLGLQSEVLRQYHQETPPTFHGQQDVWTQPQELGQGNRSVPYRSEYAYYRLPGETEKSFLLTTVFVPVGRQNLTGILAARGDPDRYGELILLDMEVEDQVPGPRQVEALVEQDPVISEQFSLWRTGGSQVWTGHLHLIPVGEGLLYMEPIFLAAEEDAIPELRRFVLSDGQSVVMTETLEEALATLAAGRTPLPLDPLAPTTPTGEGDTEGAAPMGTPGFQPPSEWPTEALDLLDSAEERLRQGDWSGFGQALDELRSVLQEATPEGASSVP